MKRRISWNLPSNQKQRILEPDPHSLGAHSSDPQSLETHSHDPQSLLKPGCNSESLDQTGSPLSKTMLDKLENSNLIRKYLTPERVKKSRSQVQTLKIIKKRLFSFSFRFIIQC